MLIPQPVRYCLLASLPALLLLGSCGCNNEGRRGPATAIDGGYVKLAVVYKVDSSKVIDSVPVASGKKNTVKDVMEAAVQQKRLAYQTKAGQHGMIDAIDGLHTNGTQQYWWLCVNDTCAAAGFEDQEARPGSTITWRYVTDGKQPCKFCSYNN